MAEVVGSLKDDLGEMWEVMVAIVEEEFMASGEECLNGWVRAGGGEVNGGGVNFGISRTLLSEIPEEIMGESGGEVFGVDERAV
ncbi:hypothetical protein Tco_1015997 [Tanacetum coccineum]|uniref:Uncharacterized protein n=1 Tax=Tanacetum coccineum TaxID=301880 RepID=A0ABQ5FMG1_9ASTR